MHLIIYFNQFQLFLYISTNSIISSIIFNYLFQVNLLENLDWPRNTLLGSYSAQAELGITCTTELTIPKHLDQGPKHSRPVHKHPRLESSSAKRKRIGEARLPKRFLTWHLTILNLERPRGFVSTVEKPYRFNFFTFQKHFPLFTHSSLSHSILFYSSFLPTPHFLLRATAHHRLLTEKTGMLYSLTYAEWLLSCFIGYIIWNEVRFNSFVQLGLNCISYFVCVCAFFLDISTMDYGSLYS